MTAAPGVPGPGRLSDSGRHGVTRSAATQAKVTPGLLESCVASHGMSRDSRWRRQHWQCRIDLDCKLPVRVRVLPVHLANRHGHGDPGRTSNRDQPLNFKSQKAF